MKNTKIRDIIILNRMLLNPYMKYVEGYENIYFENGEYKNNNKNIIKSYISLSTEFDENWNNFAKNIKTDCKRFVNFKENISLIKQNIMPKGQNSDINAKNNNNTNFDGERKNNEKNNKDNDLKIIDSDNLSNIPKEELEDNSDRDLNRTLSYLQILFYYDCEQNFEDNNLNGLNNNNNNQANNLLQEENNIEFNLIDGAYNSIMNESDDEMNPEISKSAEIDNKMTIIINLNDEKRSLEVDANKKFSEILSEILKNNNKNNNNYYIGVCNYTLINEEETLIDNKIQNNDEVFLYSKPNKEKNSNLAKLEEDDKEILYSLLKVFQALKFTEYRWNLHEAIIKKSKNLPKFKLKMNPKELIRFLMIRSEIISPGITILEHEHKLVCCLTNDNWICNQCQKSYKSNDEKFFCSLCDYSMCQNCRIQKNYERRKTIKKDVIPDEKISREVKIFDEKNHKLIYCITSRNYLGETFWNCNKCKKEENNGWGFYCTICDYDVCIDCFNNPKSD